MNKRKVLGTIVTVAIIATAVCTLPFKKKIDQKIQAVQWDVNDEQTAENIKVSIKGNYNRYIFRKNSFKGDICIEGYDFTYNAKPLEVKFSDGYGYLIYRDRDETMKFNTFGFLVCSDDFSEILIGVMSPVDSNSKGWGEDKMLTISGNASNLTEAQEVARRLAKKSSWLSKENRF